MKKWIIAALLSGTLAAGLDAPAAAQTSISSLVGDQDCFGLGGSCPDGTLWSSGLGGSFFNSYQDAGDPTFTDKWSADTNVVYTHTYALAASIFSASLHIRTAGLADDRGPWNVYFNGFLAGQFATITGTNAFQRVVTSVFTIDTAWLTGSDEIRLAIEGGDGYSIDYSELVLEQTTVTPEPVSMALLATGLLGVGALRRRRRERHTLA